jgi:hypothetical protein
MKNLSLLELYLRGNLSCKIGLNITLIGLCDQVTKILTKKIDQRHSFRRLVLHCFLKTALVIPTDVNRLSRLDIQD